MDFACRVGARTHISRKIQRCCTPHHSVGENIGRESSGIRSSEVWQNARSGVTPFDYFFFFYLPLPPPHNSMFVANFDHLLHNSAYIWKNNNSHIASLGRPGEDNRLEPRRDTHTQLFQHTTTKKKYRLSICEKSKWSSYLDTMLYWSFPGRKGWLRLKDHCVTCNEITDWKFKWKMASTSGDCNRFTGDRHWSRDAICGGRVRIGGGHLGQFLPILFKDRKSRNRWKAAILVFFLCVFEIV